MPTSKRQQGSSWPLTPGETDHPPALHPRWPRRKEASWLQPQGSWTLDSAGAEPDFPVLSQSCCVAGHLCTVWALGGRTLNSLSSDISGFQTMKMERLGLQRTNNTAERTREPWPLVSWDPKFLNMRERYGTQWDRQVQSTPISQSHFSINSDRNTP